MIRFTKKPIAIASVLLACVTFFSSTHVLAAPPEVSPTVKFSNCLVDALNGKERKELAKWIFVSMSVHPFIQPYAQVSETERKSVNQYVGKLITRLMTEDCPAQLKNANAIDPLAIQRGFELVGQVAMQELMSNEATMNALTGYVQYTDQAKISEIFTQQ